MPTMILLRHGQSMWNAMNVFTGWVDVALSEKGINEALRAGELIANTPIDMIFTSTLMRAQQTAMIAMAKHSSGRVPIMIHDQDPKEKEWTKIYNENTEAKCIPTYANWHLNERYYGELQGKDKQETRDQYGDEQVKIWRRSYDIPPPKGESLKLTAERTLPYLNNTIIPVLEQNKTILVSAHGNSLRSIIMQIEKLNEEQVLELEVATGDPLFYDYKDGTFIKTNG